jgi:aromatic-L-amino-acid/L-tryptophan decarboxylase
VGEGVDLPHPSILARSSGGRIPVLSDRRDTSLDLTEADLRALLAGVTALGEQELAAARDGPVFERPPAAAEVDRVVAADRPLPVDGESVDELLAACASVLAAGRRTTPAFFGYVQSPPAPVGVAADLLASAADQNVTSWRSAPAAAAVEQQTLRWLGEFVGFDREATGVLVSGGSAANLTALLVALRAVAGPDADRRAMRVYASAETHFSVAKAATALGVGVEPVAVDRDGRLDPTALAAAIAADRAAGLVPICVVANAGTTATGAVDPLDAVAAVATDADVWMHVDGAYGAPAAADPASRGLFAGLDRADSVCIDAHKWLYAPVDCSALLLHDAAATARAFGAGADDYVRILAAQATEAYAFWDHGLELSRRFRALKLWATLRFYGARRLAAAIGEDIRLAGHLAALVTAAEDFELLAGPGLSVCCFRHAPTHLDADALDAHNERILHELQRDGRVYLSNATIDGRFALRACITNFRTTRDDVERVLAVVRELA